MLSDLFGNRNMERILLFLFVNEKCYGAQLQNLLLVPLTPIQKALLRLEKAGIVNSYYEGKTHLYELNPRYPLRSELENLLKKAYFLLPVQEKKRYCFIHKPRQRLDEERKRDRNARNELMTFWERLKTVKQLAFSTKSYQDKSTKVGRAEVAIISSPDTLIFQERGFWLNDPYPDTSFTSSFRWTLDLNAGLITLEHLRYGSPVFLFHLAPVNNQTLEAVDSHLCGKDIYLGNIIWDSASICFRWKVIGPNKNDELLYSYT